MGGVDPTTHRVCRSLRAGEGGVPGGLKGRTSVAFILVAERPLSERPKGAKICRSATASEVRAFWPVAVAVPATPESDVWTAVPPTTLASASLGQSIVDDAVHGVEAVEQLAVAGNAIPLR